MNPKLRQICGCKLCIIPKYTRIDLNRLRTRIVTYLKQRYVGRHTCNSLFSNTSATHHKDKMFPGGECLHATIKYADNCITCILIKPNNIIHIKCASGFCDEYTDYNITNEGLDDEPKASIFHFSEYTYQGRCATHGIIPNRPSVLRSCEENDDIKNS